MLNRIVVKLMSILSFFKNVEKKKEKLSASLNILVNNIYKILDKDKFLLEISKWEKRIVEKILNYYKVMSDNIFLE